MSNLIIKRKSDGRLIIVRESEISTVNTDHPAFWGALDSSKLSTAKTYLDANRLKGEVWDVDDDIKIVRKN